MSNTDSTSLSVLEVLINRKHEVKTTFQSWDGTLIEQTTFKKESLKRKNFSIEANYLDYMRSSELARDALQAGNLSDAKFRMNAMYDALWRECRKDEQAEKPDYWKCGSKSFSNLKKACTDFKDSELGHFEIVTKPATYFRNFVESDLSRKIIVSRAKAENFSDGSASDNMNISNDMECKEKPALYEEKKSLDTLNVVSKRNSSDTKVSFAEADLSQGNKESAPETESDVDDAISELDDTSAANNDTGEFYMRHKSSSYDELMQQELSYKNDVDNELHCKLQDNKARVKKAEDEIERGSFDDHDAFQAYAERSAAQTEEERLSSLWEVLKSPFYAHLEVVSESDDAIQHFFLSEYAELDPPILIHKERTGYDGQLLPFLYDSEENSFRTALFRCYSGQNGNQYHYKVPDGENSFRSTLIRHDEIISGELLSVQQLFPPLSDDIDFDELLNQRLHENRSDKTLTSIIRTLQIQQFEIINKSVFDSFVVQGCAGSGKSQCIIHRLFYLRAELSNTGWEHVLFITPSQLFRAHSAQLMKRFRLTDINSRSLTEFYIATLINFDGSIPKWRYRFELTEEYLPEQYLAEVYRKDTFEKIEKKLVDTAKKRIDKACAVLGVKNPDTIDADTVAFLKVQLEQAVSDYAAKEAILLKDDAYKAKLDELKKIQKQIQASQKKYEKLLIEQQELDKKIEAFEKLLEPVSYAKAELSSWQKQRKANISAAKKELAKLEKKIKGSRAAAFSAQIARQRYIVESMTSGAQFRADEEYQSFLQASYDEAETRLEQFTGGKKASAFGTQLNKRRFVVADTLQKLSVEIENACQVQESIERWIDEQRSSPTGGRGDSIRDISETTGLRDFFAHIEKNLFEEIVWTELQPIKDTFGIAYSETENTADGRQRQTKILHKVDLMFLLQLYTHFQPASKFPDYSMLCIDEAQDLQKSDFDLLRIICPQAVFNVFGDIAQGIRAGSGISDWTNDTGISNVIPLDRNYRNPAAIVDFCNKRFGTDMKALGQIHKEQRPIILNDIQSLRRAISDKENVLIVKNREEFERFCGLTGRAEASFEFLDSKASKPSDKRQLCYSVFAAKGLEFSDVVVFPEGMTRSQEFVACTRAMNKLQYFENS